MFIKNFESFTFKGNSRIQQMDTMNRLMDIGKEWKKENENFINKFIDELKEMSYIMEDEGIQVNIRDMSASAYMNTIGARIFIHSPHNSRTKENVAWVKELIKKDFYLEYIDRLGAICNKWECDIYVYNKSDFENFQDLIIIKKSEMDKFNEMDDNSMVSIFEFIKKFRSVFSRIFK